MCWGGKLFAAIIISLGIGMLCAFFLPSEFLWVLFAIAIVCIGIRMLRRY